MSSLTLSHTKKSLVISSPIQTLLEDKNLHSESPQISPTSTFKNSFSKQISSTQLDIDSFFESLISGEFPYLPLSPSVVNLFKVEESPLTIISVSQSPILFIPKTLIETPVTEAITKVLTRPGTHPSQNLF